MKHLARSGALPRVRKVRLCVSRSIDLSRTMDIQIPALTWIPRGGGYERVIYAAGTPVHVVATAEGGGVLVSWTASSRGADAEVRRRLRQMFTSTIGDLRLAGNPVLVALQEHYRSVAVMRASLVEALVVTILSQNKTGEATREAFAVLYSATQGLMPHMLSSMPDRTMRRLIRPAGPYKARFLRNLGKHLETIGEESFACSISTRTPAAVAALMKLDGVGHKTAACVLVFAENKEDIIPVDTHLWRVGARLGLWSVDAGRKEETAQSVLLTGDGDQGTAHLLFVMLGRELCRARIPQCSKCPVQRICPSCDGGPDRSVSREGHVPGAGP